MQQVIAESELFGGLPQEHIEEIVKIAVAKNYKRGESVFLKVIQEMVFTWLPAVG